MKFREYLLVLVLHFLSKMLSGNIVFNIYSTFGIFFFTPYSVQQILLSTQYNTMNVYAYEIESLYCAFTSITTIDKSKLKPQTIYIFLISQYLVTTIFRILIYLSIFIVLCWCEYISYRKYIFILLVVKSGLF
jgi:hypothetical protein